MVSLPCIKVTQEKRVLKCFKHKCFAAILCWKNEMENTSIKDMWCWLQHFYNHSPSKLWRFAQYFHGLCVVHLKTEKSEDNYGLLKTSLGSFQRENENTLVFQTLKEIQTVDHWCFMFVVNFHLSFGLTFKEWGVSKWNQLIESPKSVFPWMMEWVCLPKHSVIQSFEKWFVP